MLSTWATTEPHYQLWDNHLGQGLSPSTEVLWFQKTVQSQRLEHFTPQRYPSMGLKMQQKHTGRAGLMHATPALGNQRPEAQKFKVNFGFIGGSRPVWARDLVSQDKNKNQDG